MRVIDILEAKSNSYTSVETAKGWIARINNFLNPNSQNRVKFIDPLATDSTYSISSDQVDNNPALQQRFKNVQTAFNNSIETNDGKLAQLISEFESSLTLDIRGAGRAMASIANAVEIFNDNAEILYKLFVEDTQQPIALLAHRFLILKQEIPPAQLDELYTYYTTGTALVQKIGQQPDNSNNDLQTLDDLNKMYNAIAIKCYSAAIRKRKSKNIPIEPDMSTTRIRLKKLLNAIDHFLNLPSDSNDRLLRQYTYNRSQMTDADEADLKTFLELRDNKELTDNKAKERIQAFETWIAFRQRQYVVSNKIRKSTPSNIGSILGDLPPNYDENNPLHNTWKKRIDSAVTDIGRKDVEEDCTYNTLWKIINNQQWKCYLTNQNLTTTGQTGISMDRIDSTKNYTNDNVAFCCYSVNVMKGNLFNNELVALCNRIVQHTESKNINENVNQSNTFLYDGEVLRTGRGPLAVSLQNQLITLKSKLENAFRTFYRYMFVNEERSVIQLYYKINNEINTPTNIDTANELLNNNLANIGNYIKQRKAKTNDPEKYKLVAISNGNRARYMSFTDTKEELARIVKKRPELKNDAYQALKNSWPVYRDEIAIGSPTVNNSYTNKLQDILSRKYKEYRTAEKDPTKDHNRYKPSISTDHLSRLAEQQGYRCALSGIKFSQRPGSHMSAISVDRVNSHIGGYSAGNIQLVLTRVNIMKGALDINDFLYWCREVAKNSKISVSNNDLKAALNHRNKNVTP